MHPSDLLLDTFYLRGDRSPDKLRERWGAVDTTGMRSLITFEGAAVWLYRRFRRLEIGASGTIDQGFFTWLGRMARRAIAQNEMVYQHADNVVRILNDAEVPNVLLKGNALRFATDGFPFATARSTNDIDVLVREPDARRMERYLLDIGYNYSAAPELTPADHFHIRPMANEAGVSVELHFSTNHALSYEAAWERLTSSAVKIEQGGATFQIPSATELFWHGTTHAVFHKAHAFRLRYYLDAASILTTDTPVDWGIIDSRLDSDEVPDRARTVAWLGAAAWLAGSELPEDISRGIAPFPLHRIMRWRLGVLRRFHASGRITEKLLDEGTRCEAGMPLTPSVQTRALPIRVRRRTAALTARLAYFAWRAAYER